MKLCLMNLLVLLIFLTYKAQGLTYKATNHQDIFKVSLVKGSIIQDDQMLVKSAQVSLGKNRKLMTKTTSSVTNTISENQNNIHDLKPEVQHWKKDVIREQHPDAMNIDDMDYTPARKKTPIHN